MNCINCKHQFTKGGCKHLADYERLRYCIEYERPESTGTMLLQVGCIIGLLTILAFCIIILIEV
jgi:hypothetical protein